MTRDDLRTALGDPQIAAFLHVIREGESNQNDDAYTLINGGGHFTSFADHPFAHQSAPPGKAAGAYQFIPHTWDGLVSRYGFTNFSPQCQDEGAVALILEHYAGDAIKAGQIAEACQILGSTWTSLPGLGTARAERTFVKFGGTLPVTQPQDQGTTMADQTDSSPLQGTTAATAIPDIIAGVAPLLGPWGVVVGGLVKAFSPLFQEKLAKEIGKHTDSPDTAQQIAASVVQVAQDVTGKDDPVQATAAVQNDPQMAAKVEETLTDRLAAIAPYVDKLGELDKARWAAEQSGRDAAAARAQHERWDMTPVVVWFAAVTTTLLVLGLVGAIIYQGITKDSINAALLSLTGPLAMAAIQCWRDIFAYRFDGSKASEAQNAILSQMAAK